MREINQALRFSESYRITLAYELFWENLTLRKYHVLECGDHILPPSWTPTTSGAVIGEHFYCNPLGVTDPYIFDYVSQQLFNRWFSDIFGCTIRFFAIVFGILYDDVIFVIRNDCTLLILLKIGCTLLCIMLWSFEIMPITPYRRGWLIFI